MIKMLTGVSINNLKQMDSEDSVSISFTDDNGDKIVITSDVFGDIFKVQFINWSRFSMDNDAIGNSLLSVMLAKEKHWLILLLTNTKS